MITGKIHLSPKLRAQFNPNATLFIIVRAPPQKGVEARVASASALASRCLIFRSVIRSLSIL